MRLLKFDRLRKELGLSDVFVISTGAMVSSGFFLLPGIAVTYAGPAVVAAYLLAGVLIIPALVSQAELATAMPRAGGAYYFLDRTLGPLVGTVGGVSTWLTLVLKSAFALIGMGAYLGLVIDVPIVPAALALTAVFAILNVAGARESSGLLRVLVITLLSILAFFLVQGLVKAAAEGEGLRSRFSPFMPNGFDGVLSTVGIVFVSYIGLTKVASLAEEVRNPDRNIPLGMGLALATVTTIYVLGVFVMVAILGADGLAGSLTPVADAAAGFMTWLPGQGGRLLMVVAAIAAFSAMANAGIMAASRYPLAMARDRLFPDRFAVMSRRGTPVAAILLTCSLLALCIVALDVREVAELASALQLMLFALINLSVIVMRESRIESYDPGFRSPLYPWMQLIGIFVSLVLVGEMGWLPVLFTVGVTAVCFGWYNSYARERIARDGAIFHVFERLGRRRFAGLDRELRDIMKEKGARVEDPFDEVVTRARVLDDDGEIRLSRLIEAASAQLTQRLPATAEALDAAFRAGIKGGGTPIAHGAALLHTRLPDFDGCELVLARSRAGVALDVEGIDPSVDRPSVHALFFLVSDEKQPGRHLRILAQLAGRVEDESFMDQWLAGRHEQELKETLLRDDRFFSLKVQPEGITAALIGTQVRDLDMPHGSLVALIRRKGEQIIPRGATRLEEGDRLTIIGDAGGIHALQSRYGKPTGAAAKQTDRGRL
jgi:basic amino acid/polyamine antiporter, APA family